MAVFSRWYRGTSAALAGSGLEVRGENASGRRLRRQRHWRIRDHRREQESLDHGPRRISPFFIPATIINLHRLHLDPDRGQGAELRHSTGRTSGAHAIGDSFKIIQRGDADAMICGGTDACIKPLASRMRRHARAVADNSDPATAWAFGSGARRLHHR